MFSNSFLIYYQTFHFRGCANSNYSNSVLTKFTKNDGRIKTCYRKTYYTKKLAKTAPTLLAVLGSICDCSIDDFVSPCTLK